MIPLGVIARGPAAAAAAAGSLKTAAQEPIASGLVFFAGSAPDGSSLIMFDQIASNAATLNQNQGGAAPTLTRTHPGNGAWRGADIALGNNLYWPQSTQLKAVVNSITIWSHVSWDARGSGGFATIAAAPDSDTTYADAGPWAFRWRESSTSADDWRFRFSPGSDVTVNTNVNIWGSAGVWTAACRRSGADVTISVGAVHTTLTGQQTADLAWPAGASHICAFSAHRNYGGTSTVNNSDGGLLALAIWNRALSNAEIEALNTNPLLLQQQ